MSENAAGIIYQETTYVNQKYKDTLFRFIFKDKRYLLSLYNALNHSDYANVEDLEIKTLENAIYMAMKNDVSFVFNDGLYLYEHQSVINPNMPLRYLFYVSAQLSTMIPNKKLHSSKQIQIPVPKFVVFYNGLEEQPDWSAVRLSDAYATPVKKPALELEAEIFNINFGHNTELMEACRVLKDYAIYVDKMRTYAKDLPIEKAVDKTVEECIQSGILKDLLTKYKLEVKQMSIFEYDYNGHMEIIREESREEGYTQGREVGKSEGLVEGRKEGRAEQLRSLVEIKARKGKKLEQIADELEETVENIKPIYDEVISLDGKEALNGDRV